MKLEEFITSKNISQSFAGFLLDLDKSTICKMNNSGRDLTVRVVDGEYRVFETKPLRDWAETNKRKVKKDNCKPVEVMTLEVFKVYKNLTQIGMAQFFGLSQGYISRLLSSDRDITVRKVDGTYKLFETRQIGR